MAFAETCRVGIQLNLANNGIYGKHAGISGGITCFVDESHGSRSSDGSEYDERFASYCPD